MTSSYPLLMDLTCGSGREARKELLICGDGAHADPALLEETLMFQPTVMGDAVNQRVSILTNTIGSSRYYTLALRWLNMAAIIKKFHVPSSLSMKDFT